MLGSKGRDAMARTHSKFFKTTYDEAYGGKVTFSLASFLAEQMLASSADRCAWHAAGISPPPSLPSLPLRLVVQLTPARCQLFPTPASQLRHLLQQVQVGDQL